MNSRLQRQSKSKIRSKSLIFSLGIPEGRGLLTLCRIYIFYIYGLKAKDAKISQKGNCEKTQHTHLFRPTRLFQTTCLLETVDESYYFWITIVLNGHSASVWPQRLLLVNYVTVSLVAKERRGEPRFLWS